MTLQDYVQAINKRYKQGNATEHTFRGDLQQLLESLVPTISATNEPKRIQCGAPDYVLMRKEIPVGFIEAKDINDSDLDGTKKTGNKSQFDRYKASLSNLIFTDYLDFHLYRDGQFVTSVRIAEVQGTDIVPLPQHFKTFENLIHDFCVQYGQTIKSSQRLAELMAGKARLLADIIENALVEDLADTLNPETELEQQMIAFKDVLIHDITAKQFADVYAQTIVYGMFAARLHDPTLPTFSREEAATLIPKSNPFLRKLFQFIAGYDLDTRIRWVVDNLVEIFLACNVEELLKNYGKSTQMNDPIIHFYETFLSLYDSSLRKARGVWYTPAPVVNFIVRAVDEVLKTEFGLAQGLADTSKIKVKRTHVTKATADQRSKMKETETEEEVHRVQILDPATGTGTFLAEVVKHVYQKFKGQEGIWSSYVENNLLPRLNGFELLMASYAMAHLQLDLLLRETGFKATKEQRLRIYLTNSLEEYHQDTGTLFANWLSTEANEANHIKRDTPVMCVIGNPPYAVSSTNKSPWIQNLIADYKKDLNERKINLDDDYIKFIRYGQHFIDKNGEGILAYISNNSFIDGITHRQMRKHLLQSFDKIYILDLHGNAKKKETALDGSADQNVFDIMQGVSINFFIKTGKKKPDELSEVFYFDTFGKRDSKYDLLNQNNIQSISWKKLKIESPYFFFVPKDFGLQDEYDDKLKIENLFQKCVSGFQTKRDKTIINISEKEIQNVVDIFKNESIEDVRRKLALPEDGRDWTIEWAKKDLLSNNPKTIKVMYRPFDDRFTAYTGKSKGFIAYPRDEMFKHLNKQENISLITCRQLSTFDFQHIFLSRLISDMCNISSQTKETGYIFPLYLYPDSNTQQNLYEATDRTPNLNPEIIQQIANGLGLTFTNEKEATPGTFAPIDLLDYIYAVLHSPTYREKYKEFLKIDFPRVPYPTNPETFWNLVKLGGELRQIHLLESPEVENYITTYPKGGNNLITRKLAQKDWELYDAANGLGRIWINDEQYFDKVPLVAWEFYIGGYQPAQKWLKDRRERELSFEDILHYQKIIVALYETARIMKGIDEVEFIL